MRTLLLTITIQLPSLVHRLRERTNNCKIISIIDFVLEWSKVHYSVIISIRENGMPFHFLYGLTKFLAWERQVLPLLKFCFARKISWYVTRIAGGWTYFMPQFVFDRGGFYDLSLSSTWMCIIYSFHRPGPVPKQTASNNKESSIIQTISIMQSHPRVDTCGIGK